MVVLSLIATVSLVGTLTPTPGVPVQQAGPVLLPSIAALNNTGLDVLRHSIKSNPKPGNQVLSPLSIQLCLASLLIGAKGPAYECLAIASHLNGQSASGFSSEYKLLLTSLLGRDRSVTSAGSLWLRSPSAKESVVRTLSQSYNCSLVPLQTVGKEGADAVNQWVEKATAGRIKQVLDNLEENTTFVVVSTCTFDGQWPQKLRAIGAESGMNFTPENGEKRRVETLFTNGEFPYFASEDCEAVFLPYLVSRYGLLLIKPGPDRSLGSVLDRLGADSLLTIRQNMQVQLGTIRFPKFALTGKVVLEKFLKERGADAAFSAIDGFPGFAANSHLQQVIHSARIEVDEKGTKAAAATIATGGGLGAGAPGPKAFSFTADRPFVFMVYDRQTGAILFLGVVGDPK